MKKKILFSILFVLIMPFALLFAGCNENVKYKINFIVDEQVYYTIETNGDEYISLPNNPEKDGYEFVGWYLDKDTWHEEVKSSSFSNEKIEKNINVFAYFRYVENPILAQSISLNITQLNLEPNEQQTLTASILPDNVTSKSVVWASSNINIATVNNGLVKAINYGTAIITAKTNNNLTATCQVNVVDKSQNVQVEVYIDGQVVETLTTNAINDYKITAPQKPEDITTNPNAERYFYGWFVDSNYQTPLTEDRIFLSNGKIYGKWIDIYTSNFVYSVSKGKATITLFTNTQNATVVVVPCYINSFPVERIGVGAFTNQTMLRNVIICDGIEYIDASAFYGCNSMQSIQLPNTLKEIGANSFENCELLTKIELSNTLTKIGSNAFKNCSSLSCVNFNNGNWWLTNNEDYLFDSFIDTSNSNDVAEMLTTSKNNKIWTNYTLYIINYNLDNGILPNDAQMYFSEYTTTFDLLNPQKKGYDFAGYYGNNNFGGNQITQVIKGTKNNITIYAKYSLITYSINYVLNDGTNNPNNSLTYNIEMDNIQLLDAQKDYYDFSNWTLGNKVISEIDTSLCEDLEVTANYTPTIYTITYVLNGGINNENNPLTYTIETPTITLSPATFENETVSRWYLEENFDNRITNILVGSHEDLTLYARKGYDGYDTCVISNNVVTSLNNSFINEFNVTDIIIPNNVTSINAGVFKNKTFITSVNMPKSINSLTAGMFTGCSGIKSIVIPFVGASLGTTDGYKYPLGYLFGTNSYTGGVRTGQYRYKLDSSEQSFSYYYLPPELEYVKVLSGIIGRYAFQGCSMIQNIELTNDILEIGDYAFTGCISLKSFVVPGSVTSIGTYAFSGCKAIKTFNISNGVKTIKDLVFDNTIWRDGSGGGGFEMALEEIIIPQSIISIGNQIFEGCKNLKTIIVDTNNTIFDSRNNCNAIIITSSNTLLYGCNTTIIPNGIRKINSYAFRDCSKISSVTIPTSVTEIGTDAFKNCSSLNKVTILSLENYCKIKFANESASPLFYATHLYLQENLLSEIVIPYGIESIGSYVFSGCIDLKSITIPNTVKEVGANAFNNCLSLTKTQFNGNPSQWVSISFGYNGNPVNYSKNLYFNNSNTSVTSITYEDLSNAVQINDYAFCNCISLQNIEIPNTITSIGKYAFSGCINISNITIPNSVENIGEFALYGCNSLESISLPFVGSTRNISATVNMSSSNYLFGYIFGYKSIYGQGYNDSNYKLIYQGQQESWWTGYYTEYRHISYYIPKTLRNVVITDAIGLSANAFYGCSFLTSITINNEAENNVKDNAFYSCKATITYV